jgi:beta-N-acetylhexosaminidase
LRSIGVNVDLAPVADVEQVAGSFLQARSFGSTAAQVGRRACAFARGVEGTGVAYTLKHFPGLGTAQESTDSSPVTIDTPSSQLRTNYAAYRVCGRGPRTLVMVSSAAYPTLNGSSTPAVMSRSIYDRELGRAHISAVTISDDMEAGALSGREGPALHALRAGLDLLLYAQSEEVSRAAFSKLAGSLRDGQLPAARVEQAAAAVDRLKDAVAR